MQRPAGFGCICFCQSRANVFIWISSHQDRLRWIIFPSFSPVDEVSKDSHLPEDIWDHYVWYLPPGGHLHCLHHGLPVLHHGWPSPLLWPLWRHPGHPPPHPEPLCTLRTQTHAAVFRDTDQTEQIPGAVHRGVPRGPQLPEEVSGVSEEADVPRHQSHHGDRWQHGGRQLHDGYL